MSISFDASRLAMHQRRKRTNRIALALAMAAMGFGVFWLIWILVETARRRRRPKAVAWPMRSSARC